MMKRKSIAILALAIVVCIAFTSCSKSEASKETTGQVSNQSATDETEKTKKLTKMTAEEVANSLKVSVSTLTEVVVYSAETDPNKALGRPNQYISKVNFADERIEQLDPTDPKGGSVEVFANETDASARKEYIAQFATVPALTEYMYVYKNVLLRVNNELTPDQAKEYENAFIALQNS